jgi:DNA polymerase III epsilon subunit family exonuclease
MLPCYLMLDLETTGGSGINDRITEIAAVRIENGVETERWGSLVNPQTPISHFIENLTGINDDMVASAPRFEEVADKVLELLNGAVLVAHNAGFDHGFLRGEFARIGHDLRTPSLCTVRLSRKLYPQFKSHGLDAIMQRHRLTTAARHRAMGDVDMVLAWLAIAQKELGNAHIEQVARELLQPPLGLPLQLETLIDDVPDSPGCYFFYGNEAAPLFIGSASHLRNRVTAHLQSASKSARERGIVTNTRRIEWRQTAGELGALLLAKRLIAQLQPVYQTGPGRSTKAPVTLNLSALHPWPYAGCIGVREHDADTGRTDIHLFHTWCHLATVQDENSLDDGLESVLADGLAQTAVSANRFDLDIYRVLLNQFSARSGTGSAANPTATSSILRFAAMPR